MTALLLLDVRLLELRDSGLRTVQSLHREVLALGVLRGLLQRRGHHVDHESLLVASCCCTPMHALIVIALVVPHLARSLRIKI